MPASEAASTVHLSPGPWATLLDALCARFPGVDRARWRDRFARGRVLDAAGRPLAADAACREGQCIRYFREVEDEPPIPFAARIVHQDAHLLVVDKPHFLPVTPAGRFVAETLLARLVRHTGNRQLVPLHRIDRETAGLVLFSVDPASRAAYQALFPERRIRKRYEALAPALPGLALPQLRCSRIERGEPFFRMRESAGTANAETRIEVLERGPRLWRYGLEPHTGRKHQLRVHMAALGAPIVHDRWYPALQPQAPDDPARPLQLLARELAFDDPLDGRPRRFRSSLQLLPCGDAGTAAGESSPSFAEPQEPPCP